MSKRSRRRPQRAAGAAAATAPRRRRPRLATAVAGLLGLAVFLALVAVDTRAAASFEAPKRLLALLGIAAALALAAGGGLVPLARPASPRRRRALAAAGAALGLAVLSAALSPRSAIAFDALRTIVLFAAVAVLAAAPALSRRVWRAVAAGFVAGAALDAALSLLQRAGAVQLFVYVQEGGRGLASAWLGNTGVLGLVAAFAAVLVMPAVLPGRPAGRRLGAAALVALLVGALVGSNSVTGVLALAAGAGVAALGLVSGRRGRRLLAAGAVVAVVAVVAAVLLAGRSTERLGPLTTYRLAPWGATVEMAAERPLLGWGPGSFRGEYAPHAVAAELRWGARLANPHLAGSYAEAHNEVLQAAAELGIPAALLLLVAVGLTVAPLVRTAAGDPERAAVLAVLAAGAVAAMAWFPLQRPATAILLAAALGRAWRLAAEGEAAEPPADAAAGEAAERRTAPIWARAALVVLAVLLVLPEPARYGAERRLARIDTALQIVTRLPPGTRRQVALRRITREAAALEVHPGDERPANTAGTAALLVGDPRQAADLFAGGLAGGERPELVANLGLALWAAGDPPAARRALLRAAWVSPQMADDLAARTGLPVRRWVDLLERRLEDGRLSAAELPPPPATYSPPPAAAAPAR